MTSIMDSKSKRWETPAFCLGLLLTGGLIQTAGWLRGDRLVFPELSEIGGALIRLLGTGRTWRMIGTTLGHLAEALVLSSLIGIGLGVLEGRFRFLRILLRPTMTLLRSLPMIVMTVILMVLMNYDQVPVTATVLMLIPMISEAACEGFLRIPPELVDVYRMNSDLTGRVLLRVYLPLMAGYLKQAYVGAVGMGIKLAVTTEYLVQTRDSLGKAVYTSAYFNEYADIYAYALIMILLALILGGLPGLVSRAAGRGGPGPVN